MWPLQPTQGIPDRLAAALAALVVTGAVLTLILMLTMGGRHEAKRAVTLPVVYWSGPPPEAPDETPPEEVPVTAETVPEVSCAAGPSCRPRNPRGSASPSAMSWRNDEADSESAPEVRRCPCGRCGFYLHARGLARQGRRL